LSILINMLSTLLSNIAFFLFSKMFSISYRHHFFFPSVHLSFSITSLFTMMTMFHYTEKFLKL